MRIIGGVASGIRLTAPEGRDVRPTEDRVKESMFGTVGDLTGKTVVDLFSGTGALGLEALSRGAARVVLVERENAHVEYIRRNLAAVLKSMNHQAGKVEILCQDVKTAHTQLSLLAGTVDFVFADPPYNPAPGGYGGPELLRDEQFAAWALPGTILVLEHASANVMPWTPASPWRPLRERQYGIRAVSFAARA
ncbi:MAG: 16S rRNA (guanine(966)-N(2))-methyltransferase RsmD [Victivallales bacterium]|nr:16S rRNA (guanine(966)-N(2))-methyltransferase RsmD [Victivallales bacterium]